LSDSTNFTILEREGEERKKAGERKEEVRGEDGGRAAPLRLRMHSHNRGGAVRPPLSNIYFLRRRFSFHPP